MAQNLHRTGGHLLRCQAQIVDAQQIQVQVQRRGTADQLIVDVGAPAVLGAVAIVIAQVLIFQIEVGNVHFQMGQDGALVAPDGNAVAGNGDVHLHGRGVGLIVAVLILRAAVALLDDDLQRHGRGGPAGAGRRHRGGVGALVGVGEGQHPAVVLLLVLGNLGLRAVIALRQGVGQLVAFTVCKDAVQIDFFLCAGGCLKVAGIGHGNRIRFADGKALGAKSQNHDQCQHHGKNSSLHENPPL